MNPGSSIFAGVAHPLGFGQAGLVPNPPKLGYVPSVGWASAKRAWLLAKRALGLAKRAWLISG